MLFELPGELYFTWCCIWLIGQAFDHLDLIGVFLFFLFSVLFVIASAWVKLLVGTFNPSAYLTHQCYIRAVVSCADSFYNIARDVITTPSGLIAITRAAAVCIVRLAALNNVRVSRTSRNTLRNVSWRIIRTMPITPEGEEREVITIV